MKTKRNNRLQKTTTTDESRSHPEEDKPAVQSVLHHVQEIRRRLFWSVLLGLVVGVVVYNYHDFFIRLIMAPLGDEKLVYLNPAGGFNFIFTVTFYATMLIMLPFLLYQVYAFIKPAIPRHTRRLSISVVLVAALLMMAGVAFSYTFAVPAGLHFLTQFADDYVVPTLTADSYLSFVLGYIFGVALLFEVPLLLLFWHWINPMTPGGLLKSERLVIVGAFVVAAIISPSPDAMTQTIIAVPIVIVYQFGVIAVLFSIRKQRKTNRRARKVHALGQKPEASLSNVRVAKEKIHPVTKPIAQQQTRPNVRSSHVSVASVDGIIRTRKALPISSMPTTVIPKRSLRVAQRTQLISDFTVRSRISY